MNGCIDSMVKLTCITMKGFENVGRQLIKQNKFNRKVAIVSLLTIACIYVQQIRIEKLSDEVRELKRTMEE